VLQQGYVFGCETLLVCAWPRVIPGLTACLASGKYPWAVFSPRGPSSHPGGVLDATAGVLHAFGPFGGGLDVSCGTGAAPGR
jgi:hypothetical protein